MSLAEEPGRYEIRVKGHLPDVIAVPTGYISNPGSTAAVQWGSVLEFMTAASGVATAVILYPITRRVSRTAAIGFVTSRVVEAALILVGVVSILSVVTLQHHFAAATGAQAQALGVTGESLVAMRQWTLLLPTTPQPVRSHPHDHGREPHQDLRAEDRRRRHQLHRPARPGHRLPRAERCRQVDHHAHDRGPGQAHQRQRHRQRPSLGRA